MLPVLFLSFYKYLQPLFTKIISDLGPVHSFVVNVRKCPLVSIDWVGGCRSDWVGCRSDWVGCRSDWVGCRSDWVGGCRSERRGVCCPEKYEISRCF